jgi:hypothetical protein
MAAAQLLTTLTPENWTVTDPEKRANGSASAWINLSGGSGRPAGQTPRFDIAFDASYGVKPDQIAGGEDMSNKMMKIELNVRPDHPDTAEFVRVCDRADQTLVGWAAKNSYRLFRQQLGPDTVGKLLRPTVKPSQPSEAATAGGKVPKTYPPHFRVKINVNEFAIDKNGNQVPNPRKTEVYVVSGESTFRKGSVQDLRRGCEVICIVEFPSTWISGMSFGYNIIATKILVFPSSTHSASSGLWFNLPTPMTLEEDAAGQDAAGSETAAAAGGDESEQGMDM